MINRKKFFERMAGALHVTTKGDIQKCVQLWRQDNRMLLSIFSPYRWARWKQEMQPNSIRDLNILVESWGLFDPSETLSGNDESAILNIIHQREANRSHSARDQNGNSSTIFELLSRIKLRPGAHHCRAENDKLSDNLDDLLVQLSSIFQRDYSKRFGEYKCDNIWNYFRLVAQLKNERQEAIAALRAQGQYINGDLNFYLRDAIGNIIPLQTDEKANEYINNFLSHFIRSAHTCYKQYEMQNYFQKVEDGRHFPCLVGKSRELFTYADSINECILTSPLELMSFPDIMYAIMLDLEIDHNKDALSPSKKRILEKYENRKLGIHVITAEKVQELLETLDMDDNNLDNNDGMAMQRLTR